MDPNPSLHSNPSPNPKRPSILPYLAEVFGPGLFSRFATEENVRSTLSKVYGNVSAVDDELVDILVRHSFPTLL